MYIYTYTSINVHTYVYMYQFSLVTQSCLTLRDSTNRSMPGLPVHYQLPEFTQTHVHRIGDAIQPSHPVIPFSSCLQSFPASGSFQMSQLFASGGQSYWSFSFNISPFNEHSGLISFRMDICTYKCTYVCLYIHTYTCTYQHSHTLGVVQIQA